MGVQALKVCWKHGHAEKLKNLPDVGLGITDVILIADFVIAAIREVPALFQVGKHHRPVTVGDGIGEFRPRRTLQGEWVHQGVDESEVGQLHLHRMADDVNEAGLGETAMQEIQPCGVAGVFQKDGKGGGLLKTDLGEDESKAGFEMIEVGCGGIF